MARGSVAMRTLACVLVACLVLDAPCIDAAISCGQVISYLSSCLTYLQSKGGAVPPPCCKGVKTLNTVAKTTPDRRTACNCLKSLAAQARGINLGLASGLPGKCGVSVPYKISPSTDCSKVT
ncbi:non-specific lipid-transfer protein [Salmonella sp. NW832]|uniref:non-specific lipid-transfer protein n=1 Tax=Salmonella sp. NW832 TaxID=2948317 RepID=UPI003F685E47